LYSCPNLFYSYGEITVHGGVGFDATLTSANISDLNGVTSFYDNGWGVWAKNSSSISITGAYFCSNDYADLITSAGAYYIHTLSCYFPNGNPRTSGSGIEPRDNRVFQGCSGLMKTAGNVPDGNTAQACDPVLDKFRKIVTKYFDLAEKVRKDNSGKGNFDKGKYRNDYLSIADNFKEFVENHPESLYSKTALTLTVHIYRLLEDYETMNKYLQETISDTKLASVSGLAKRFMLDYYRSKNDFTTAITASDEILKEQKQKRSAAEDTLLICDVLFAKGLIYAHDLNKSNAAKDCFTSIIKEYPDNSMVSLAKKELSLLGVKVGQKQKDIQTSKTDAPDFSVDNYPNPFNPSTTISYTLPEEGRVQIKVFDMLGREVVTLLDGIVSPGKHSIYWNGNNSASGIYFYSISFKGQTLNKKMLLMK